MPIYNITETKPATMYWEFTVIAESEEEALRMVQDGEVESDNYYTQEDAIGDSEYTIEEE